MNAHDQRNLIRFAGFAGGVLIGLARFWPWSDGVVPLRVAGYDPVLLAGCIGVGCIGVIVVEYARRSLPAQRQVDADEVDSVSDAELRRLLAVRKYFRATAMVLGFLLSFITYRSGDLASIPGFIISAVNTAIIFAFILWFFAELLLSVHPRQRILKFVLQQRRSQQTGARIEKP